MKNSFDFCKELVAQNDITIDSIGNFILEAINEDELIYYYLMIKSIMGECYIITYGPVVPDINGLEELNGYSESYFKMEYNEGKLSKLINSWLNDKNRHITKAQLIDKETFVSNMKSIKDLANQIG